MFGIKRDKERSKSESFSPADILYKGLFYYKRSGFSCKIGRAPCDFFINSKDIRSMEISKKNINNVMELHMVDNSVLEFYSPDFNKMVSAMQQSINHSKSS